MRKLTLLTLLMVGSLASAQTMKILPGFNGSSFCSTGGATATSCTTAAVNASAGTLIVAAFATLSVTTGSATVTDSSSLTWHALTRYADLVGNANVQIFYAYGTPGSSETVTFTVGLADHLYGAIKVFSGTSVFKSETGAQTLGSSGTSLSTGSLTIAAGDLVYSATSNTNGLDNTLPSSGYVWASNFFSLTGLGFADAYGSASQFAPHNCTSNSCGTFTVSASTEQNPAYFAFDGTFGTNSWLGNNSGNDWICLDLGSGNSSAVYAYGFTATSDVPGRSPKTWTFEGSNTNCTTSLTTLDTETNVPAQFASELVTYGSNDAVTTYRYFRIHATANQNSGTFTGMSEIYLYTVSTFGSTTSVTWTINGSETSSIAAGIADFGTGGVNRHRAFITNQ